MFSLLSTTRTRRWRRLGKKNWRRRQPAYERKWQLKHLLSQVALRCRNRFPASMLLRWLPSPRIYSLSPSSPFLSLVLVFFYTTQAGGTVDRADRFLSFLLSPPTRISFGCGLLLLISSLDWPVHIHTRIFIIYKRVGMGHHIFLGFDDRPRWHCWVGIL